MTEDTSTYYVWIGGSCDYGHKERAGGAAVVIEHNGNIISRDVISDLHTTEFRMMLTLMIKVMQEIPEGFQGKPKYVLLQNQVGCLVTLFNSSLAFTIQIQNPVCGL